MDCRLGFSYHVGIIAHWLYLGAGAIDFFARREKGLKAMSIRGQLMRCESQGVLETQAASAIELGGLTKQLKLCREEIRSYTFKRE